VTTHTAIEPSGQSLLWNKAPYWHFRQTDILVANESQILKNTIFWNITPCIPLKSTDVSEEHIVYIFSIEE
jgi:hypothetical protein